MPTYLRTLDKKPGYYFQRGVPKDLQGRLGKLWKLKAGNTRQEATREALRLLTVTDHIIEVCRKDPTRRLKLTDLARVDINHVSDFGDNDPIDASDVVDHAFIEKKRDTSNDVTHDWQLLIDKILERNPDQPHNTIRSWRSECKAFVTATGCNSINDLTHDIVDEYVMILRDACRKQDTLNSKFARLKSLNEYAMSFRWTTELYFNKDKLKGIKIKEHARGTIGELKVADISVADEHFSLNKIGHGHCNSKNHDNYIRTHWIMRYTLGHISEVEGLMWEDIDMQNKTISIQANELRELKTDQRGRKLPMIDPLYQILLDMYNSSQTKTGSIFGYRPKSFWGTGIRKEYQKIPGSYSPSSCRHHGSGIIQSKHGNLDRRVKYIHGHGKKGETSTAQYGDISTDSLRPYLELLM